MFPWWVKALSSGGFYFPKPSQLTAPFPLFCLSSESQRGTLDAKYMLHNDDTTHFLETSELLRGYPSDPFPLLHLAGVPLMVWFSQHLTHLCGHSWLLPKTIRLCGVSPLHTRALPFVWSQQRFGKTCTKPDFLSFFLISSWAFSLSLSKCFACSAEWLND